MKPKRRAARKRKSTKRAPCGPAPRAAARGDQSNPGARLSELAKAIGVKSTQVHALIAKARAEKLIVKKDKVTR